VRPFAGKAGIDLNGKRGQSLKCALLQKPSPFFERPDCAALRVAAICGLFFESALLQAAQAAYESHRFAHLRDEQTRRAGSLLGIEHLEDKEILGLLKAGPGA